MSYSKHLFGTASLVGLVALAAALLFSAPSALHPQAASAQGVTCAGVFYPSGETCGTTSGATTSTGTTCNGVFVPDVTSCPATLGITCNGVFYATGTACGDTGAGGITCNGVFIPGSSSCVNTTTTTQTCPNGSVIALGSVCSTTTFTCPNGTVIFSGQSCSLNTFTCPDGSVITSGQVCATGTTQFCNGSLVPSSFCTSGTTVSFSAGWNLVGGPTGTILTSASGPIYTLTPGSSSYVTLPPGTPLQGGSGYWVYFPTPTTVTLATAGAINTTISLPAGPFILIGNPSNSTVSVGGPGAVVLVYNPTSGSYTQTSQLNPGQGAWAASATGGQLSIVAGPGGFGINPGGGPPPPPPPL